MIGYTPPPEAWASGIAASSPVGHSVSACTPPKMRHSLPSPASCFLVRWSRLSEVWLLSLAFVSLKGHSQNQLLPFLHGSPLDYEGGRPFQVFFFPVPTLLVPSALLPAPTILPALSSNGAASTAELTCSVCSEQHRRGKGAVFSLVDSSYFSLCLPINSP